jgi:hypothetical protein
VSDGERIYLDENKRMYLGTDEDLERHFGPHGFLIGTAVRPPGYVEPADVDERDEQQRNG